MPRSHPSNGKSLHEEAVKYSLLMPRDIDAKVEEICHLRRISKSELLREILLENIDQYRARARGHTEAASQRHMEKGQREA